MLSIKTLSELSLKMKAKIKCGFLMVQTSLGAEYVLSSTQASYLSNDEVKKIRDALLTGSYWDYPTNAVSVTKKPRE